jgi:CspA family cold shock protein
MKTGIISWFSDDKGFGFIKPDDKSKDIFFHVNELKKINLETIAGNTKISFETKEDKNNRIQAVNLQLI